eukprot:CCRYP_005699-RA/>CCRYP_005699-RA protein AED:0.01 eAED:0.01 QI:217/1/1/1/0.66/0.5/4/2369/321
MTITYEEALSTLQSMFTSYTPQQLDAVLRHHNGHMENTVETLLTHQGTPEELTERLKRGFVVGGGGAAGSANIDADEELARQLAREDQQRHQPREYEQQRQNLPPGQRRLMSSNVAPPRNQSGVARETTSGRGTATTLPVDFLRIPGRKYPQQQPPPQQSVGRAGGMTDEQLARMLQDELFQEELRNNPEFSHLAGRRHAQQMTGRSTYSGAGGGGGGPNWEEIGNRLSELGDAAKRRFQEFAANWSDPNRINRNTQRPAAQTTERRGLLSSNNDLDMEEEMNFVGGSSAAGDAVELRDVGGGSGAGSGSGIDWSGDKKKD